MNKSELFYEQRLLNRWLLRIKKYRKSSVIMPYSIETTENFSTEVIEACPKSEQFFKRTLPFDYGEVDTYLWTKAKFKGLDPNKKYYGEFNFGTGSGGLTVGAETLLYVDEHEVAAVDLNHQEINLGNLNSNQELVFRTWSGIADETRLEELDYIQGKRFNGKYHTISTIEIYELDTDINNLYYNLFSMLEAYQALKVEDVNTASILISDLSKIFLKYDELDITRNLLLKLNQELQKVMDNYPQTNLIKMIAVGQTHIDLAWLWRVKHTREKAARSFSTMLNLMDNNPEYTFFQSQPQLFDFLKEDYPKIYKRIQKYVELGRIDIDGAMWIEADCNIPTGESLTRQILYGKQFIKKEFGTESKILWMPDVFGYSWAMPQILKKSGVDTFCTTKMQWNQHNRMPFNTFKWRGIDGTDITTHLIEDFDFFTINAKSMLTGSQKYKDKDISNEILYQYGFGDGGGGPRQQDIELVKRFNKIPGLPAIEYDTASNYFSNLNDKIDHAESYVHTWDGELYLELHRGTYTSQAEIKKYNRNLEFKLRELEMKLVKAKQDGFNVIAVHKEMVKVWRKLLLNQFHDIIPGSSIHDANVDAVILYKEIADDVVRIEENINDLYPKAVNSFAVFNSFNLPVTEVITYPSDKELEFYIDEDRIDADYQNGNYAIIAKDLTPLAYTMIDVNQVSDNAVNFEYKPQAIVNIASELFETKYYKIKFNEQAQITYLFDKQLDREVVIEGKVLNKVVSYEDKPLDWDAWDIDIFYKQRERELEAANSITVVSKTKIETIIKFDFTHLDSTITQTITLSNLTSRIDIMHDVYWNNPHRLLRVLCETGIRATKARYDIQYGNVERPTYDNTSWDIQKFEVLGHKWADISNKTYGIALLNDCKYGYSASNDVLGLSLIKAAQFPDKTQDIGNHQYTYSIYIHEGDVLDSDVELEAFKLNNQITPINISADNSAIINLQASNISVDAIKIAEEGNDIIVRLHENKNTDDEFNIACSYQELNLMEEKVSKTNKLKAFEIKTLKIIEE